MRTQAYFSSLFAMALALNLAGCLNGTRSSTSQKLDIKPRSNAAGRELATNSSSATTASGTSATADTSSSADATDGAPTPDASTATDPLEFIGSWDGTKDDIPAEYNWKVTNVLLEGNTAPGTTTPATSPTPPATTPTTPPTANPSSGEVSGNQVTFTIQAGTRAANKSWNDSANPVKVKIGGTLIIKNADSVSHTLHTNGAPFEHGSPIPPGGQSEPLTIGSQFQGFPEELYEHDDSGGNRYTAIKFYLRTE